jgi:hypothetical protein
MAGAPPDGWSALGVVDDVNGFDALSPFMVFDPDGNAFAFWNQRWTTDVPSSTHAWGAVFNRTTGWGVPNNLSSPTMGFKWVTEAAACPDGSVVAVSESDGVQARVFTRAAGWGAPVQVAATGTGAAELVCDSLGVATVAWNQGGPDGDPVVAASRYYPASGWTAGVQLSQTPTASTGHALAVDAAGNVMAIWGSFSDYGGPGGTSANRFSEGFGWSGPMNVSSAGGGSMVQWAPQHAIVAEASGNFTAAWVGLGFGASAGTLYTARYSPSAGWAPHLATIFNGTKPENQVDLAGDDNGNLFALWASSSNVYSARLAPGGAWGAATELSPAPTLDGGRPRLAAAPNGLALAVWPSSGNNTTGVQYARYSPSAGWGLAEFLVDTAPQTVSNPRVAVDGRGVFGVAWQQGSPSDVWAAFLSPLSASVVLTEPQDGTATTVPTVRVSGRALNATRVAVNGLVVDVQADGNFSLVVALSPGNNTIIATAWDSLGFATTASVVVRFDDPVPGLLAALEAARAELANLSAQLNATNAALAAAEAQVAAAYEALNATRSDLNATRADLDAASNALAAAQAQLADAEAAIATLNAALAASAQDLASLSDALNQTQGDLAEAQASLAALAASLTAANATIADLHASLAAQHSQVAALRADLDARAAAEQRLLDDLGATRQALSDARAEINASNARADSTESALRALEASQGGLFGVLLAVGAGLVIALVTLQVRNERKMRELVEAMAPRSQGGAQREPQGPAGRYR